MVAPSNGRSPVSRWNAVAPREKKSDAAPAKGVPERAEPKLITVSHKVARGESIATIAAKNGVIYVVEGDKAKQRAVKVGVHDGNLVEVEGEGLKEGDAVVTVGAYGLPKETKVKVIGQ